MVSYIPPAELARRAQVIQSRDGYRTYNNDLAVAQQRWKEVYAPLLPPRLARLSLEDILSNRRRETC